MSDLISRQAVLELIDFYDGQNQQHFTVDNLRDDVENVPSVMPKAKIRAEIVQSRWIPVSERLPDSQKHGDKDFSDWVEVTILIGINKKDAYVGEAYYCFSENKWYAKRFVVGEVIAWMPLPQPYKAESEDKE